MEELLFLHLMNGFRPFSQFLAKKVGNSQVSQEFVGMGAIISAHNLVFHDNMTQNLLKAKH